MTSQRRSKNLSVNGLNKQMEGKVSDRLESAVSVMRKKLSNTLELINLSLLLKEKGLNEIIFFI